MTEKFVLRLDLTVNRILPAPARAARGIGLFRVSCAGTDNAVSDTAVVLAHGSSRDIGNCGTLVIRTDKPLTLTYKSGGVTSTLTVTQLFAATADLEDVSIAFDLVGGDGQATVTIIQA